MKKLANFIRSSAGRKAVPSNHNQHMYEKPKMMENIYKEGLYEFETSKEGVKKDQTCMPMRQNFLILPLRIGTLSI